MLPSHRPARAQEKEQAELANALRGVTVSLEQGLSAATSSGTPISGKFEVEDGKLQLSVYTMKGDQFSEVIVDHKTGRVGKTEKIEEGEDLAAAKSQSAEIVGDTDDLFYDSSRKRLYVTGGDGYVDVLQSEDANRFSRIARVPTASGARTSLFVPEQGRLYVAVPHPGGQKAEVRVYQAR